MSYKKSVYNLSDRVILKPNILYRWLVENRRRFLTSVSVILCGAFLTYTDVIYFKSGCI